MTTPPASNEVEISIFGTGRGESILLHIPQEGWIVVDSCVDPISKQPVALEYLNSIGVDSSEEIQLVLATHWHDDHVKGISKIVSAATKAKFAMSSCLRSEEFFGLIKAYGDRKIMAASGSGIDELLSILQAYISQKKHPIFATESKIIYRKDLQNGAEARILCLSPSDYSLVQASQEFLDLFPDEIEGGKTLKRVFPKIGNINHTSVVLWVEVSGFVLLLGADMETVANTEYGWKRIVDLETLPSGRSAHVFKIPHHGSATGHSDDVWKKMVCDDSISVCTPFSRSKLPLPVDVERILSYSEQSFIASSVKVKSSQLKSNSRMVKKLKNSVKYRFKEEPLQAGHVRVRFPIDEQAFQPNVELFNGACHFGDLMV